jgi:hypothetical protein
MSGMRQVQPNDPTRVVSMDAGVAMVVTDLHGDWDAYRRYRDRFLELEARGQADYLIFTGDLIHSEGPPEEDGSLDIVLDVMELRAAMSDKVIYLLGNHEFPHLYSFTLQKGEHLYTPRFEAAMGEHRAAIVSLFDSLPFYVRTRAGVSLCHAGAFPEVTEPGVAARVFSCSHRQIWEEAAALLPAEQRASLRKGLGKLHGESYDDLARRHLAVSGPDDPRYDDLLIGSIGLSAHPDLDLLWSVFFTRNEWEYDKRDYALFLDALLRELSIGFHQQQVLIAGHMACRGGYTLVADGRQLRLASGSHAHPRHAARCLLFDVGEPVQQAKELLNGLESVLE